VKKKRSIKLNRKEEEEEEEENHVTINLLKNYGSRKKNYGSRRERKIC